MNPEWAGLGGDEGTKTLGRRLTRVARRPGEEPSLEMVAEDWSWEGMHGTSYIFLASQAGGMTDEELLAVTTPLRGTLPEEGEPVVNRRVAGFVFVNYVDFILS